MAKKKPAAKAPPSRLPADVKTIWDASRSLDSMAAISQQQWDPNGPAVELPLYGASPPTVVGVVNSAIAALEQGMFFAAAYLADGMMRDDRLRSTLDVRIDAITGAVVDMEPAKDTNRARSIKEDYEEIHARAMPQHQVGAMLRNGIMLTVAIGQVLTERAKKSTTPSFRVWNNRYLRWDWLLRRYCLVTENRGEIVLDPEDPEWIIYEPYGPYAWLNSGAVRSVTTPWLIRYWTRTWWSRYQEVHGHPIRAGIIPTERDPADEKLFLKQLANISHEAVIRLPQGEEGNKFDVKLIEASANGWQGFKALLEHCDQSITIAILGQRQSTEGQGGLGTQKDAGEDTLLKLSRKDALIYEPLREKIIKPWAADNYGDEDMAPYVAPQIEPPEDLAAKAKHLSLLADAVSKFATAPDFARHVDIRAMLESFEIPLRPEDQVPPDVPGTPQPLPIDDDSGAPLHVTANPAMGDSEENHQ
jgi:hypothetical protein